MRAVAPLDRSAGTRDRLVRAAVTLFQSRGYHATGIAEILAAAGAPKGSLYHHFPGGKQALGVAAVEWLEAEMVRHFAEAAARRVAPRRLVARLFDDVAVWLAENRYRQGALLAVLAQEAGDGEEGLRAATAKAYDAAAAALAAALSPGAPEQAVALARTVLAALDGAVAVCRARRSTEPIVLVGATVLALLD